jgi:preprotein translocase subunit YajC
MFIAEAWAQGAGAGGGSDFLVQLFPLVLIFIVFYFLLIRPQQSKMRQQKEMLAGVKRGDRVVTGGGIIGLVTKVIGDNELQVELAEGVRVRIIKQTITDILTRGESVRGAKDSEEDEKPMLPTAQPGAAPERRSLLGALFGRKQGKE